MDTSSDMFRFALRPLAEVEPWGASGNHSLSWFALTDGHYAIKIGDAGEVFRYNADALNALGWSTPANPRGFANGVDYQVARLFHDLVEALPWILEPVPDDIATVLETPDSQAAWLGAVEAYDWENADADAEALHWVDLRTIGSGHLRGGPSITMWRVGDRLHLRCDNRARRVDGVKLWASDLLEAEITVDAFVDEVTRFGSELLTRMGARTARVEAGWSRSGVRLVPAELRQQHEENVSLWRAALVARPTYGSWDFIRRHGFETPKPETNQ